ncbi:MAG: restriction endonuclease subunit S [Flavobacteriales bacterium]|nr:restriction endonuclease subunit S [Flavobacteriales bacterium]
MKQRTSISELARKGLLYFSDGYRTKKPELGPSGYPIMRVAQVLDGYVGPASEPEYVRDEFKKKIGLKSSVNGDVILTTKGTVGRMAKITAKEEGYVYSPQVCFFRILDERKIDKDYLFYTMAADDFRRQMLAVSTQTDMAPYINLKDLGSLELDLLDLSEQRSIASVLGALDDKIELNRRMNGTLEAMAQALFKEWFVDGAEEEWVTIRLGDMLTLDKGLSYKGKFLTEDEGLDMVNLGCFGAGGRFKEDKLKHYTGEYKAKHLVRAKDIVMANTDITQNREVIGSPALVPPHLEGDVLFTHHVFALRINEEYEKYRLFLYYALLENAFRERAVGYSTGTTVLSLPRDTVEEHELLLPDEQTIDRFNTLVTPLLERGWANYSESQTLTALRDTLLPKLMRGEVRVKEKEPRHA